MSRDHRWRRRRSLHRGAGAGGWAGPGARCRAGRRRLPPRRPLAAGQRLGGQLAAAAVDMAVLVVAAGEISTRVFRGAPGGYHPDAAAFDQRVVEQLSASDTAALLETESEQRRAAGESLLG